MYQKITKINPWHFLWISVLLSELFTAAVSTLLSNLLWGRTIYQVLIVGAIDSLFVPLLVVPIIIFFVFQISRLRQELNSRKEAEDQIRFLAYYDSLTSLPNRIFFKELLERAIAYAERHGHIMAVLFIDLDNFKRINDTLGHHEGDKLLQSVTNRLIKSTRGSDYVARWENADVMDIISRLGGDEFILLLHDITDPRDPGKIADRILRDLSEPFDLNGREVLLTASIGI
jgi:diguanylate cyclase (GGDEF)-like protein